MSVIIPAYNAEDFIEETLESVFQQTYDRLEIILVDDGSTDRTAARVRRYGDRVRYIPQRNAGAGAARNRGLSAATGDYIAFLDADDVWRPEKLAVQLDVAGRHPTSGLVACDGGRFSGDDVVAGRLLSRWVVDRLAACGSSELSGVFYREALRSNPIASPSQMLIPRSVTRETGPMITGGNDAEDWDYTLRIALRYPITMHQHSLVRYRVHDESRSGKQGQRHLVWGVWDLRLLRRHAALCPPEERVFVQRTMRDTVRMHAYDAYCHARRHDARAARRFLWWLLRQAPAEPRVAAALVGACLPEGAVRRMVGAARRSRATLRWTLGRRPSRSMTGRGANLTKSGRAD
ncbi:MAG TPA: glycosyltransferase [Methylomirabilota bacterium]|nr:glycosyltransferase [Methylomirabilota bacterium]